MTLRFCKGFGLVLAACAVTGALFVSSASGQGRGRGHGGGGGLGIGHGGGDVVREIRNPPVWRGQGRGRNTAPGIARGPIEGFPPRRIFSTRHDNRNPFPGTPRRRRVRRGYSTHTHGRH